VKVVALAGGVGGAKLADGLSRALLPEELTVIVNTGDDFEHWGLQISPDLDTVCYTLAGLANPETGWGLKGETWQVLEAVRTLGGPDWFRIGDRDLATHLERTRRLRDGEPLSQITRDFCKRWGISCTVLPMTDDTVATIVQSDEGDLAFQEYFVHRSCAPRVKGFRFAGIESARPAPGVLQALATADAVVICPSNPWVSVDPILAVITPPGLHPAEQGKALKRVVAVSPFIGGRAIKGPAAKMSAELGLQPNPLTIARHYSRLGLSGLVLDQTDESWSEGIREAGIQPMLTNALMTTSADRLRLAQDVLNFIHRV
jgi:LPPG:FO 2-phospho-L-lactate transferase